MKILIEDHRTAHAERMNDNRYFIQLIASNIVMVRNTVQGRVSKLSYQVCGLFRIIYDTRRGITLFGRYIDQIVKN